MTDPDNSGTPTGGDPAADAPAGGGPENRPEDGIDRSRAWLTGIGLGALVLAAMVVSFVIGTNYSDDPAPATAGSEDVPALPQAVSGPGRDLFTANCGACHTLAEADATGTAGPDLDTLAPDAAIVEQAIAKGGTGTGMMPPGLLTGEKAQQVAEYVAAATGGG